MAHPLYRAAYAIGRFFRALSLTDPKAWDRSLWQLAGAQSLSGEVVTEQTSLQYSAVWNAVELISSTIAALPLQLYQQQGKTKTLASDRKIFRVMHSAWNPYMSAKRGREVQIAHVLLWGNGYAEKVRDGNGEVIALWPIHPSRVTPQMRAGQLVYDIRLPNSGETVTLLRDSVLHILGPSDDGFVGYSRIAMARKCIGLGMALETFGSRYFGAGTHPGVIVSHPGQLSAQAHQNMQDALNAVYSGLGNSHRLMLLEEGLKIEKLGIPPNDSQFLESRQFTVTDVARWFGVPPHKLKDLTRSSFSNIESEQRSFYTDRILPDVIELEQAYDMQLLTDGDRMNYGRGRLYFKHSAKGILRADVAAQSAFYGAMLDRGVMSINEVRELEDLDPIPGGDIHLVPLNMTTLQNAGKVQAPKPTPELPEPEPSNGNGAGVPARRGEQ